MMRPDLQEQRSEHKFLDEGLISAAKTHQTSHRIAKKQQLFLTPDESDDFVKSMEITGKSVMNLLFVKRFMRRFFISFVP